jgi:hypothetical protein
MKRWRKKKAIKIFLIRNMHRVGPDVLVRILNCLCTADAANFLRCSADLVRYPLTGKQIHSGRIIWRHMRPYLPLVTCTEIDVLCGSYCVDSATSGSIESVVLNFGQLVDCSRCLVLLSNQKGGLRSLTLRVETAESEQEHIIEIKNNFCDLFKINHAACSRLTALNIDLGNSVILSKGSLRLINENCRELEDISGFSNFSDDDMYFFLSDESLWPNLSILRVGNILVRCQNLQDASTADVISTEQLYELTVISMSGRKFPTVNDLDISVSDYEVLLRFFEVLYLTRYGGSPAALYSNSPDDSFGRNSSNSNHIHVGDEEYTGANKAAPLVEFDDNIRIVRIDTDYINVHSHWEQTSQWAQFYRLIQTADNERQGSNRFVGFYRNLRAVLINNWLPSSYFLLMLTQNLVIVGAFDPIEGLSSKAPLDRELDLSVYSGCEDPSTCMLLGNTYKLHYLPFTTFQISSRRQCLLDATMMPFIPLHVASADCISVGGGELLSTADELIFESRFQLCSEYHVKYMACHTGPSSISTLEDPYGDNNSIVPGLNHVNIALRRAVVTGRLRTVKIFRVPYGFILYLLDAYRNDGLDSLHWDLRCQLESLQHLQIEVLDDFDYSSTTTVTRLLTFYDLMSCSADTEAFRTTATTPILQFVFESCSGWQRFVEAALTVRGTKSSGESFVPLFPLVYTSSY